MEFGLLLVRRMVLQTILVASIDRRVDRIGEFDERGGEHSDQLSFEKRIEGDGVAFGLFAVAINVLNLHEMLGLATPTLSIFCYIKPAILPKTRRIVRLADIDL